MADVLIKDMVMPDRCGVCDLYNPFFDTPYCRRSLRSVPPMGRPKWCPLVEVPPHGRLVDWDEVEKCIEETADCDIRQYALSLISWAAEKRVVVEASEGGEQITEKEKA